MPWILARCELPMWVPGTELRVSGTEASTYLLSHLFSPVSVLEAEVFLFLFLAFFPFLFGHRALVCSKAGIEVIEILLPQ